MSVSNMYFPSSRNSFYDAGAVSSGGAFLVSELEKKNYFINEPLTSTTFPRDVQITTGGGWVDFTSNYFSNYYSAGPNQLGLLGQQTTILPVVSANLTKDTWPTYIWGNVMRVNYIDMKKMEQLPISLNKLLDTGIKLSNNKMKDYNYYLGMTGTGQTGLLNNPNITTVFAANGASGKKQWSTKTPQEIINDIDGAIVNAIVANGYDESATPNHILIDWPNFAYLNRQILTVSGVNGGITTLRFLQENNIAARMDVPLMIFPSRWCVGAGNPITTGGANTQRMMVYHDSTRFLEADITVPVFPLGTEFSIEQGGAYLTLFLEQLGPVKFLAYSPVSYTDGI